MFSRACVCPQDGDTPWSLVTGPFLVGGGRGVSSQVLGQGYPQPGPGQGYTPPERTCHGQDVARMVLLLNFHVGGLSCINWSMSENHDGTFYGNKKLSIQFKIERASCSIQTLLHNWRWLNFHFNNSSFSQIHKVDNVGIIADFILMYLHFSSLFAPNDISKCEIRNQGEHED